MLIFVRVRWTNNIIEVTQVSYASSMIDGAALDRRVNKNSYEFKEKPWSHPHEASRFFPSIWFGCWALCVQLRHIFFAIMMCPGYDKFPPNDMVSSVALQLQCKIHAQIFICLFICVCWYCRMFIWQPSSSHASDEALIVVASPTSTPFDVNFRLHNFM